MDQVMKDAASMEQPDISTPRESTSRKRSRQPSPIDTTPESYKKVIPKKLRADEPSPYQPPTNEGMGSTFPAPKPAPSSEQGSSENVVGDNKQYATIPVGNSSIATTPTPPTGRAEATASTITAAPNDNVTKRKPSAPPIAPESTNTLPPLNLKLHSKQTTNNKQQSTPAKSYSGSLKLSNLNTPAPKSKKSKSKGRAKPVPMKKRKNDQTPIKPTPPDNNEDTTQNGATQDEDINGSMYTPFYAKTPFWFFILVIAHTYYSTREGSPFLWESAPMASHTLLHKYNVLNFVDELQTKLYPGTNTCVASSSGTCESMDTIALKQEDLKQQQENEEKKREESVRLIQEQQNSFDQLIEERLRAIVAENEIIEQQEIDAAAMQKLLESPSSVSMLSLTTELPGADASVDFEMLDKLVEEHQIQLISWEKNLLLAEAAMTELEHIGFRSDSDIKQRLSDLSNVSPIPVSTVVIDQSTIQIPGEDCSYDILNTNVVIDRNEVEEKVEDDSNGVIKEDYLSRAEFEKTVEYITELAQSTTSDLMTDPELSASVHKWVEQEISHAELSRGLDRIYEFVNTEEDLVEATDESEMSLEMIQSYIDKTIEKEAADGTGKRDYASIAGGGSVIRNGIRKTSPSLVENLPIGNRILAALKLRFYGHPAEAALTPTYPKYALGQCWSFTPTTDLDEMDEISGKFGSLAVNLSNAIYVKSVSIEHPPKDMTPSPNTAIRNFRVIGYQDENAKGYPWDLGSFTYDINSNKSNQEFKVSTQVYGSAVPMLQSVTLAIDSNWGDEYSCLYRFRVHDI